MPAGSNTYKSEHLADLMAMAVHKSAHPADLMATSTVYRLGSKARLSTVAHKCVQECTSSRATY